MERSPSPWLAAGTATACSAMACCAHELIGWRRAEPLAPFMKMVASGTAPPLPEPTGPTEDAESNISHCGARLVHLDGGFCSVCFETMPDMGVLLSCGTQLCAVCAGGVFVSAEQLDTCPPPSPPVALFAEPCDASVAPGRQRELLISLQPGEELRVCGCVGSVHVSGRTGYFVGYCARRQLAILRVDGGVACVPLELLRRPEDATILLHKEMLKTLAQVGTAATLQHGIACVQRSHSLCGTAELAAAEQALRRCRASCLDWSEGEAEIIRGIAAAGRCSDFGGTRAGLGECFPTAEGLRTTAQSVRGLESGHEYYGL